MASFCELDKLPIKFNYSPNGHMSRSCPHTLLSVMCSTKILEEDVKLIWKMHACFCGDTVEAMLATTILMPSPDSRLQTLPLDSTDVGSKASFINFCGLT